MNSIINDCGWLAVLDPYSESYAVWRGSLVGELVDAGYSAARAEQVIDSATRWAMRTQ
ncbi:MAG: hypothetical protein JWN44_5114 [Myxococcales bacterium]|nr:hypothetical protein [Myxococcales bacterium]